MWTHLKSNGKINSHDVSLLCFDLYDNRGCCKYALFEIFEKLYPDILEVIPGVRGSTENVTEIRFKLPI